MTKSNISRLYNIISIRCDDVEDEQINQKGTSHFPFELHLKCIELFLIIVQA